jgi:WD40 repeat protein
MQVWCVTTGLLLVTARGHTGEISDLSLSADGSMVASGATDADVRVWSLQVIRASLQQKHSLTLAFLAEASDIWCVRHLYLVLADGSMVASGATDADVRVWSLQVDATCS